MHPHVQDPEHIKGVRTVAAIEFAKGMIVVLAGLGVFSMRHRDIWGVAESFLEFFHANPYNHYVGVFITLVYRFSDVRLWKIALVATLYVTLRFAEAFGLWYVQSWAEWVALLSGCIYIPFELADLFRHPTWFAVAVFLTNVVIVLYMLKLRIEARRKRHPHAPPPIDGGRGLA